MDHQPKDDDSDDNDTDDDQDASVRVTIPERDLKEIERLELAAIRGLTTKFDLLALPSAWLGPHIRTENINLHTTFPRRWKLRWPRRLKGLVGAFALIFLAMAGWLWWIDWTFAVVPPAFIGSVLSGLVLAGLVALPGTGTAHQLLRQYIGAKSWAYDLLNAVRKVGLLRFPLGWLLGSGVLASGATALLDRWFSFGQGWSARLWPLLICGVIFAWLVWLAVVWLDRVGRDLGRDRQGSLPQQVHRLSMVQALSWTPIPTYRARSQNRKKMSPQRPLVFVSTYNEGIDGYVGGFVEGMRGQLDGAWGLSPGFPRPDVVGFRPFMEYVNRTSVPLDHSFVAYPHCSVGDIRNALHLDRTYRSFRIETTGSEANRFADHMADLDLEVTDAKFRQFVDRVRPALPSVPDVPDLINSNEALELRSRTKRTNDPAFVAGIGPASAATRSEILLSWMSFDHAERDTVRAAIQDLPGGYPERDGVYAHSESPFMHVPGTHFARLAVVGDWYQYDRQEHRTAIHFEAMPAGATEDDVQPADAFLVLAAHVDATDPDGLRTWIDHLNGALGNRAVEGIFGPASRRWNEQHREAAEVARPIGSLELQNLVLANRHQPTVRLIDHPDATLWDIVRALWSHRVISHYLYQPIIAANPKKFATRPLIVSHRP